MRKHCLECALKHVAQALVLLCEVPKGYPLHKWVAVGHLAEAEDECNILSIKTLIRETRHGLAEGKDEDLMAIIDLLNQELESHGSILQ